MSAQNPRDLSRKPPWAKDAVFYQIFPDRFARSDRVPKPANLLSWNAPPSPDGYHGGDLLGIVEHMDYLADLGINAIYLTPIFQSACNHRYHTHDYEKVDPLLGGNRALRELVEESHRRDIRILLDGVLNHASRGFFQFHDLLENGPHSPWLSWFQIQGWPLSPYNSRRPANYTCWHGNRALPKFNTDNPEVREFLMGIGEFWIREYDIDGWRLDVPQEITTPGFWEEFRERVRTIKPDAYLVGEIWRAAPEWVAGDRFDATMNYVLGAAAIAYAGGERVSRQLAENRSYDVYPGIEAAEFGHRIQQLLDQYDWETTQVQLNLLGSHDAPRILSIAGGDKATVRLATMFQMTFPGAPCIYYGDEIGLRGTKRYARPHRDQDARWPFPWHNPSSWDRELLEFFREVVALRHSHSALRRGNYEQLYAQGQQFAFVRHDPSETLLVVLNAADQSAAFELPAGGYFSDGDDLQPIFGAATTTTIHGGRCAVNVPPRAGVVLGG